MTNNLLSITEAATVLGVSKQTVRKWIRDGLLNAILMGRRIKVDRMELERILREGTSPIEEGYVKAAS